MESDLSQTAHLLQRWHQGDKAALGQLLDRDLDWIKARVRNRMGELLAAKAEVDDYVQDAMMQALQYGPKFLMSDMGQFRALMARIVESMLRNKARDLGRDKRSAGKERPITSDSILYLDPPQMTVTRPSMVADRNAERDWLRLAVGLLTPEDAQIVRMREWDKAPFADIGQELGIKEDAARIRFQRCLPKLAKLVQQLRAGEIQAALDMSSSFSE